MATYSSPPAVYILSFALSGTASALLWCDTLQILPALTMRKLLSAKERIVERRPFLWGQICTIYITTNLVSLAVMSAQSVTCTIGRRQLQNVEVHTSSFQTEADLLTSTNLLDEPLKEKTAMELRLGMTQNINKEHQQEVHHQIAKAQRSRKSIHGT